MGYILVVDDYAAVRDALASALRGAGYEVATAANGAEALVEVGRAPPALILLDIRMPVMDGLTFLRTMRGMPQLHDLPVLIVTALEDPRVQEHAARLGVRGVLVKSKLAGNELLKRVAEIVSAPIALPPVSKAPAVPHAPAPASRSRAPSPADRMGQLLELKPIVTRAEVDAILEGCAELRGFSPAAQQVLSLTSNPKATTEQVAKAISRDHAVALKVLKLANSAVYSRGMHIDSVQQAVIRIGMGQIRQAILNLEVVAQFSNRIQGFIDPRQFWEHGIATGVIAALLLEGRPDKEVDAAFTLGLLHDVGRIILATHLGERYGEVLDTAERLGLPLERVEHRLLLVNHAEIMQRVLGAWKFSKHLINPIAFHHLAAAEMRRTIPKDAAQAAIVAYADSLAHALMLGSSGIDIVKSGAEYADAAAVDPERMEHIRQTAGEQTDAVKLALLLGASEDAWPQLRNAYRKELRAPFEPVFVSSQPKVDTVGIFCDELRTTEGPPKPGQVNVGVVHLNTARDCRGLSQAYHEVEIKLGKGRLPLIVIAPNALWELDREVMADRHVKRFTLPLAIKEFIAGLNEEVRPEQVDA